ncbi:hypothetical protein AGMMS50276_15990 [Synergistales bacterium]|nr:hypothetical protein AGMMS50276_15990 [Synergistales bacterium]
MWKELLESFLYSALEVFYPELYCLTDTTKKPVFLNKELRIPGSRGGQRIVDLLADIHLKTGEKKCLLLHAEVQGKIGKEPFSVRMYKYSCLIALRLSRPFVALAIRTTPKGVAEETKYETKFLDSESTYKYHSVFIDNLNEESLLNMKHNPLAISTLAAMRIAKAGRSETKRFEQGKEMVRLLKQYGFPLEVMSKVGQFIEGITNLSMERLLKDFDKELDVLCEERDENMYMTPIMKSVLTRKALKWAKHDGKAEGKLGVASSMLVRGMSQDLVSELTGLSPKEIDNLEGAYEKALEVARNFLADGVAPGVVAKNTGLPLESVTALMNLMN